MIVLDTHIWIWWAHSAPELTRDHARIIREHEDTGLGVSAISCWEVAKLVEYGRLILPMPTLDWFDRALAYPGVRLLPLTPAIITDSAALPGPFHKDPSDPLIVATARVHGWPLLTADRKILAYPHVQTL